MKWSGKLVPMGPDCAATSPVKAVAEVELAVAPCTTIISMRDVGQIAVFPSNLDADIQMSALKYALSEMEFWEKLCCEFCQTRRLSQASLPRA
jgi:hypothetical protein